ncbi:MAG TPA: hypothetical protein VFZ53_02550 [Polyangiaceae bacterium]
MQSPRVLRCPQCGAPLDAPPQALSTRCAYCGHSVKLEEASPRHPMAPPPRGSPRRALVLLVAGAAAVGLGALAAFLAARPAPESTTPPAPTTAEPAASPPAPSRPVSEKTAPVRYPLRSLSGVDTSVDIDGSRAHLLGLFPGIDSKRHGDELRHVVPLEHPWFSAVELGWKNEPAGKLTSVAFKPPAGLDKFENQKEIGDCLAKGLGKPEIRVTDHLAGEQSYFWGRHFPKAWANLYSGYLWLTFQSPRGIAPVTFPDVVRTLDGC